MTSPQARKGYLKTREKIHTPWGGKNLRILFHIFKCFYNQEYHKMFKNNQQTLVIVNSYNKWDGGRVRGKGVLKCVRIGVQGYLTHHCSLFLFLMNPMHKK